MPDILSTERLTCRFRLLAVLAVGVALLFHGKAGEAIRIALLCAVHLSYAYGLHVVLPRGPLPWLVYLTVPADSTLLGFPLHLTGSAASLVILLFHVIVRSYAVNGAYAASVFAQTVMVIAAACVGRRRQWPSPLVDVVAHRLRCRIDEEQGAPRRISTVGCGGHVLVPVSSARQGA